MGAIAFIISFPARDYYEYIPLSTGLFDRCFHGIQINDNVIHLLNKAVGKNGLLDKRSRAGHHNHHADS